MKKDMNIFTTLRIVVLTLMLCPSLLSKAQSNGDKLFMEGQTLQQTQTVAAQNQAIRKFKAAKVVYKSTDKQKMCDNQIAICNKNIVRIKTNGGGGKKGDKEKDAPEKKLEISQNTITFDSDKKGAYNINVKASSNDWFFSTSEGVDGGQNFATIKKGSDANSIDIEVTANPYTLDRQQTVMIKMDDITRTLTINQKGKNVTLSANTNIIKFKPKGGDKLIEIYTNSDSIITDYNDLTWYIESKPEWIETNVEVKKEQSALGKGLSALKGLVKGKATAALAEDVKITNLRIFAQPLLKSSPEFQNGRIGEIIFASQDKRYKISVIQQK